MSLEAPPPNSAGVCLQSPRSGPGPGTPSPRVRAPSPTVYRECAACPWAPGGGLRVLELRLQDSNAHETYTSLLPSVCKNTESRPESVRPRRFNRTRGKRVEGGQGLASVAHRPRLGSHPAPYLPMPRFPTLTKGP